VGVLTDCTPTLFSLAKPAVSAGLGVGDGDFPAEHLIGYALRAVAWHRRFGRLQPTRM